jgi:hypothetical protein
MGTFSNSLSQSANAQLGIGLPLMYGYCRVRGDNIMLNQNATTKWTISFYILGEGEWDGIERLWINKKLVDHTLTSTPGVTAVHFHPGKDGTLGSGLSPTSSGGDQLVDSMFNGIPPNFQPLTFSRKAYLAVNVPPDPAAPSANLDVLGDYRTSKVRIFDASGNQTAYQFSTNGAWQALDLILRKILNPEWTTAGAAAAGGDLTSAQKARIDFPSIVSAAAWCDTVLGNGQKRFESSVAFVQTVKLNQALTQLLTMSQLYITEEAGKIFILPDQPRASTFLMTSDHVVAGTASFDKVDLHGAASRIIASFNDVNPQDQADIDTPGNTGLSRSSNVVTVKTKSAHPFVVGDQVQICPPLDGSTHDASFDGVFPVTTVPDSTHFTYAQTGSNATSGNGYCGTPESRFAQRATQADHLRFQKAIGQRGLNLNAMFRRLPLNIDLGNNTMERALRILNFLKNRNLGVDTDPYVAPWKCKITAFLDAVDSSTRSLIEQLCGDIITVDRSISEEFQGDYELTKKTIHLPSLDAAGNTSGSSGAGSAGPGVPTIELELLQYLAGAFSDSTLTQQSIGSAPARGDLAPQLLTDNQLRNGDFSQGTLNWQNNSPTIGAHPTASLASGNIKTGVSGLPRGSTELFVPSATNDCAGESVEFLPVDFNKTYLLECWLSIASPLANSNLCIIGFNEYDGNKSFINHTLASAFFGEPIGVSSTSGNTWQYFAAEISGNGGTTPSSFQFNQAAQYVRIAFCLNMFGSSPAGRQIELLGTRWSEVAAGSVRAIGALDGNYRLKGSFRNNPLNVAGTYTAANPLTQSGTTPTINVASSTIQYGDGTVSYNSGSVNPGVLGTFYIYADDPTFAGGAVTYLALSSPPNLTAANGRIFFGKITTLGGGGGGGDGGGGGGGTCFSGNTRVRVPGGSQRLGEMSARVEIELRQGTRWAELQRSHYEGWMHDMGDGELVTPGHLFRHSEASWIAACELFQARQWFEGTVYTLHVKTERDDERYFVLESGHEVHNYSHVV